MVTAPHNGSESPVAAPPITLACATCGCKSFARVYEADGNGGFRPGPMVRCVGCKSVGLLPIVASPAAGREDVEAARPCLRDRLPLLAHWLFERAYFNEAKDIYSVVGLLKTAEDRKIADAAEIAYLTKGREASINAEGNRYDMYLTEKDDREAAERDKAALMEVVKPFAEMAVASIHHIDDDWVIRIPDDKPQPMLGHFASARAILAEQKERE